MYFRIEKQTVHAPIALWDAEAGKDETPHHPQFEAAFESGALVLVNAVASSGSVLEVFVDEPVPTDRLRQTLTVNRELRLHCASGSLAIGPAAAYWSGAARRKHPVHQTPVEPGDYYVKVHTGYSDEIDDLELAHAVGEEDLKYYTSKFNAQNWGCFGALLGLPLAFMTNWGTMAALAVFSSLFSMVLTGLGGHFLIGYLNRRNPRFRDIEKRIKAYQANRPFLIFELTRMDAATASGMKGGELSI